MFLHRLLILLIMLITFMLASLGAMSQTIPPDREGLEKGEGMGMGLYGEINGYPGPKHVLELKDTLHLSYEQISQTQRGFDEMRQQSMALGQTIITMEEKLNNAFRSHDLTESSLVALTTSIGQLRGQLRVAHLRVHLLMREVLTDEQLTLYMHLRGHTAHGHH